MVTEPTPANQSWKYHVKSVVRALRDQDTLLYHQAAAIIETQHYDFKNLWMGYRVSLAINAGLIGYYIVTNWGNLL